MSLSDLLQISGAPGDEEQVRSFIYRAVKAMAVDIAVDSMGNLIVTKKAAPHTPKSFPRVMIAAHMDEPGMIITSIHSSGMLTFKPIGILDPTTLLGSRVLVGNKGTLGVIGGKPIHRLQGSERRTIPRIDDMMIDIGAADEKAAASLINIGDYATFAPISDSWNNDKMLKGKALPSRVGCAILLQLLTLELPMAFTAVFTVQKEVGLRGAQIAAYRINPDIAFVIDAYPAQDFPGVDEHQQGATLGGGVALNAGDTPGVDMPLTVWLARCATETGISIQWQAKPQIRRESSVMLTTQSGIRAATLALPCRYMDSPYQVMSQSDIDHTRQLITDALLRLAKGENLPC
jgi:putative aminopeptidase FrvX